MSQVRDIELDVAFSSNEIFVSICDDANPLNEKTAEMLVDSMWAAHVQSAHDQAIKENNLINLENDSNSLCGMLTIQKLENGYGVYFEGRLISVEEKPENYPGMILSVIQFNSAKESDNV